MERLKPDDREQFILDNQYAFKYGISGDFHPEGGDSSVEDFDGEIISRKTIENSIDGGVAYRIKENGINVGGLVLSFRGGYAHGDLELLFVSPDIHSKGIGCSAWKEGERLYPEIDVWETETPSFETRNIHFYVNKCGFRIVEFFNAKHPDPHDPETGKEERYEDTDGGMFRFEKVIR
ncbi:MAG: GNAT family N-acetyltransferase [Clostridia bacterium]|nr:GNAT family N-acetyltransferase [Clostridia bacterium]